MLKCSQKVTAQGKRISKSVGLGSLKGRNSPKTCGRRGQQRERAGDLDVVGYDTVTSLSSLRHGDSHVRTPTAGWVQRSGGTSSTWQFLVIFHGASPIQTKYKKLCGRTGRDQNIDRHKVGTVETPVTHMLTNDVDSHSRRISPYLPSLTNSQHS